jgi:chromosome segregation ATPase
MVPMPTDPAEARKRRKEIIQSHRSESEFSTAAESVAESTSAQTTITTTTTTKCKRNAAVRSRAVTDQKPPKKRKITEEDEDDTVGSDTNAGNNDAFETTFDQQDCDDDANNRKKTQIRYDPEIPMNKDQLAAWRREARRVRNRESAAASRQRIRNRISELEDEVSQWKARYSQAMQRLEALETAVASKNSNPQVATAGTEV